MGKITVLIVDDAYFMRNLIKKNLKEANYEVVGEAKNGMEGVKLYFDLKPDVVCMDINMPDISGIEATRQILSKDPKAKIIAITGSNDDEIKQQMMEAGAKEYLRKPFQPAFLWTKLDNILNESVVLESAPLSPEIKDNPNVLIVEDDIEDSFEEIEILDKPDASKMQTLVVENNEDLITFPEEFTSQEQHALSREKIEEEFVLEEPELIVNHESLNQPSSSFEKSPVTELQPQMSPVITVNQSSSNSEKESATNPTKENPVTSVNIRPPRARILREDPLNSREDEDLEEPVINISSTNYNDEDKPKGLFGKVKKLFKK